MLQYPIFETSMVSAILIVTTINSSNLSLTPVFDIQNERTNSKILKLELMQVT